MLKDTIKSILLFMSALGLLVACEPDYGIVGHKTEYIEVPVEIEVEVPQDPVGKQWVDSFIQPSSVDGVDILWVIDTSCSMHDDYDRLMDGIEAMMNSLPPTGWRLNMITNSSNVVTNDQQFPLVPGDTIADAENMYNQMYTGYYEEGFDSTYEYILNNAYAPSWMRRDAALLVVFVSDEEDQSDMETADFISWYSNTRSTVYLASIVNVDPAISVCTHSPGTPYVGQKYIDATNHFNGVVVDICSEDWTAGVADASNQVEPYEWYELTYTPLENTIRVFTNHQPSMNWYYEPSDNTVYFTATPTAGTWVEIVYRHEDPEPTTLVP